MLATHFNYVSWSSSVNWVVPPLSYAGWVTIVALSKLALGSAWANGILVFNLMLAAFAVVMVLRLVERLTSSRLLVCAAGLAFVAAFELWLWIPYALSDVSFMFLSCAVVFLLCLDAGPARRRSALRGLLPFVLALVALVYRPAGLPLLLLVIVATMFRGRLEAAGSDARTTIARWSALSLCILIALAVVLDAALMSNPGRWPFPFLSGWIQELSREYRQGIVIFGRPDTYHSASSGLLAFVWLNVDRLRAFFAFFVPAFSRGHDLANIAFFVPVYAGWIVALFSILKSKSHASFTTWWATVIGSVFVVFFAVFHSLQYIDYDWRYRLPCLPVLVMLGAIGWREVMREANAFRLRTFARDELFRGAVGGTPATQQLRGATPKRSNRRSWIWGGSTFMLAAALMALITSVVYSHDSRVVANLRATEWVMVTNVARNNYGFDWYGACLGGGTLNPPPVVGAQVRIFYNPNDPCDYLDYDPVARQRSNLTWLLAFSAIFSLAVGSAGWDFARQR